MASAGWDGVLSFSDMELDADICYRALVSRDPRFDGRFFAAVMTTGIYCRPICPAPKPHKRNVRYFSCAAAAEEAGFRACFRCRPETAPGTPVWIGTSSTVTRALRLISEGFLDGAGVDDLAARLGMGARHLRRLFMEHLGAAPIAVAQTRRVHFAKALVDGTALPLTEVALSAGFSSIRRFNTAFKKAFGMSPTRSRSGAATGRRDGIQRVSLAQSRSARRGARRVGCDGLELRLPYRPPFDWRSLLEFLHPRGIPGVESVVGDTYRRTVRYGETGGTIEVTVAKGRDELLLRVPSVLSRNLADIVERVRRLFDLRADPHEIVTHLARDPILKPLVRRYPGLRVPGAYDGFETSIRALLGQQVTVKGATTIAGRLVERYGVRYEGDGMSCEGGGTRYDSGGTLRRFFPTPERLSRARPTGLGIPAARVTAIREIARAFHFDTVRFDGSLGLDAFVGAVTELAGVGPWTAHYVAMRVCREPDAFPSGDLALRRAATDRDAALDTEASLLRRSQRWRPWRAYATMYLWTHYIESVQKGGS